MIFNKLYLAAGLTIASFAGGAFLGYQYCDGQWQTTRNNALEAEHARVQQLSKRLATVQTDLAKLKRTSAEMHSEEAKYISSGAPDNCKLDDERLQQLACAVRPSTCER